MQSVQCWITWLLILKSPQSPPSEWKNLWKRQTEHHLIQIHITQPVSRWWFGSYTRHFLNSYRLTYSPTMAAPPAPPNCPLCPPPPPLPYTRDTHMGFFRHRLFLLFPRCNENSKPSKTSFIKSFSQKSFRKKVISATQTKPFKKINSQSHNCHFGPDWGPLYPNKKLVSVNWFFQMLVFPSF
jgi:hypothetical protein